MCSPQGDDECVSSAYHATNGPIIQAMVALRRFGVGRKHIHKLRMVYVKLSKYTDHSPMDLEMYNELLKLQLLSYNRLNYYSSELCTKSV